MEPLNPVIAGGVEEGIEAPEVLGNKNSPGWGGPKLITGGGPTGLGGFIGLLAKLTSEKGSDESLVNMGDDVADTVEAVVGGTIKVGWTPKDSSRLKLDAPKSGFKGFLDIFPAYVTFTKNIFWSKVTSLFLVFTNFSVLRFDEKILCFDFGCFCYYFAFSHFALTSFFVSAFASLLFTLFRAFISRFFSNFNKLEIF